MYRFKFVLLFISMMFCTGFNTLHVSVQGIQEDEYMLVTWFQYITCIGSSLLPLVLADEPPRFNTLHVSVQE